jgi:hypothetical protein
MSERRKFLVQSAAVIAATGLGWRLPFAEGGATPPVSSDRFKSYVNQSFSFYDLRTGARTRLTLAAVQPGPSDPKLDQFSLVFRGRAGVALKEGRYAVVGGPGRRSELFITRVSSERGINSYRADFSLLL